MTYEPTTIKTSPPTGTAHVYELVIPDEPPIGTLAVGTNGYIWQRVKTPFFGVKWQRVGLETMYGWRELLTQHGPVTLVRWGEQ